MATKENEGLTVPAGSYTVDPVHSTIEFQVSDMSNLFATIKGHFLDFEGTLETGENLENASARGVVRVGSLTTHQEQRDQHLRSPDFLDGDRFPEIRFETSRIEREGERLRIAATLTLKDTPQPIELEGRLRGAGRDPQGNQRVAFDGQGELDFGPMKVQIDVGVSAVKAA